MKNMTFRWLIIVGIMVTIGGGPEVTPNVPNQPEPQQQKPAATNARDGYARALELFRAKNYAVASTTLQSVLDSGAPVELQDNCHYWLGECSYAQKNYNEAITHFQQVFTFARSEKKDDAQIMIANCYFDMGDKVTAKKEYERLVTKFPASPFVKKAKERLGRL